MDLSWRLSRRGAERAALDLGAKSMAQGGAGAFHLAFKTRIGVSALAVTTAFLLTAGSLTAIRDQAEVGDRVDTSLVGTGLAELETLPHDTGLPRIQLAVFVPHMAVKTRTGRGDTVTTLSDGRILVVGDLSSPDNWNGARVYSSLKGVWQSTAYLADKRRWHTSTLIHDGSVLVTGGRKVSGEVLRTVELFDTENDSWTSTSFMNSGRSSHAAALLNDGRVLVVGGFDNELRTLASVEIYDPDTRVWTQVADMIEARSFPTASVLDDGRVLVAGGSHTGVGPTAMRRTAEIYDPTRNIWKPAGQFAVSRAGHTATILSDGRVLVVGGAGSASTIALAEVYDPVRNDWSPAGSLTLSRTNHSASTMSDGRVIVAGGWGDNGSAGHLVELFDPRVGTWLTLAASP
jgi:N-acetylneuraminic acid mutarotase